MRGSTLVVLLALLLTPAATRAQWRGPYTMIDTGDRVRFEVSEKVEPAPFHGRGDRVQGTVLAIAPDTVVLLLDPLADTVAVPRLRIVLVEMSLGAASRRASANEMGSYVGLAGALISQSSLLGADERSDRDNWFAAAVGLFAGYAMGAAVGAVWPREQWRIAWIPE